jgi:hypothetical protein
MCTNSDATPCNDLYFLGSPADPLSVQIIGFEDNRALLYKFETTTSNNNTGTRTEVESTSLDSHTDRLITLSD